MLQPCDQCKSNTTWKWNTNSWEIPVGPGGGGVEQNVHFRLWVASQRRYCWVLRTHHGGWSASRAQVGAGKSPASRIRVHMCGLPNKAPSTVPGGHDPTITPLEFGDPHTVVKNVEWVKLLVGDLDASKLKDYHSIRFMIPAWLTQRFTRIRIVRER